MQKTTSRPQPFRGCSPRRQPSLRDGAAPSKHVHVGRKERPRTRVGGLRIQQDGGDGGHAPRAGQVQRRGAGAHPVAGRPRPAPRDLRIQRRPRTDQRPHLRSRVAGCLNHQQELVHRTRAAQPPMSLSTGAIATAGPGITGCVTGSASHCRGSCGAAPSRRCPAGWPGAGRTGPRRSPHQCTVHPAEAKTTTNDSSAYDGYLCHARKCEHCSAREAKPTHIVIGQSHIDADDVGEAA